MASDSFAGSAGALTTPWTQRMNTVNRDGSGAALASATGANTMATYDGAASGLAQYVEFVVGALNTASHYVGACVRGSGTGGSWECWAAEFGAGDFQAYLNHFQSGSYLDTVDTWDLDAALNPGDVVRVEVSGDTNPTVTLYVNAVEQGTAIVVSSGGLTGTLVGIDFYADFDTARATIVDWEGGDLGGGGATPPTIYEFAVG